MTTFNGKTLGFPSLKIGDVLNEGGLITLAVRPTRGQTSLSMTMALAARHYGMQPCFMSTEYSFVQLHKQFTRRTEPDKLQEFFDHVPLLHYADISMNTFIEGEIHARLRVEGEDEDYCDLFFIDGLERFRVEGMSRGEDLYDYIGLKLTRAAKALRVPIVVTVPLLPDYSVGSIRPIIDWSDIFIAVTSDVNIEVKKNVYGPKSSAFVLPPFTGGKVLMLEASGGDVFRYNSGYYNTND